ncbi:hypothetical protein F2Q69_00063305 [Brassica cretica]|uniref:Uncharacterized protein n=1 Tax=Brassica cretica TaxID=69181 RepID=A0A8S9RF49_BRACR|nr:hypothetical protein F2Q69_00063305 [Brassica cretica]
MKPIKIRVFLPLKASASGRARTKVAELTAVSPLPPELEVPASASGRARIKVAELTAVSSLPPELEVVFEPHTANSGVRLIAESALADRRFQSYVAIGYPSWCP